MYVQNVSIAAFFIGYRYSRDLISMYSFYFSVVLLDSSKFSNLKNWTAHINGQSDSNTGVSKARKIFKFSQTERQRMIN